jgi:imidazolonepropionase-like amidohydrolase
VLVPTLSCFYGVAGLADAVGIGTGTDGRAGTDARSGTGTATETQRAQPPAPTWSPLLVELAEYNLEQADRTLKAAKAAGVRIAAGHDWHPFWNSGLEIRRMIAHGLTPGEALSAATAGAAHALGLDDHVGTVTPGKLADLAIFDGDPLDRPELLTRGDSAWLVLQRGAPVAGAALERDLGGLAPASAAGLG